MLSRSIFRWRPDAGLRTGSTPLRYRRREDIRSVKVTARGGLLAAGAGPGFRGSRFRSWSSLHGKWLSAGSHDNGESRNRGKNRNKGMARKMEPVHN